MKKVFMLLASLAVVFAMASCGKDKGGDDNLIDDGDGKTEENLHASLKGSEYYPIIMDAETFAKIEKKVAADLRPNDESSFLYVWNGYEGATAEGLNFYGVAGEYTSLSVANNAGWSGFGLNVITLLPNFDKIAKISGDYYLHFCYKGAAGVSHCVYPTWGGKEYRVSVGDGSKFEDNGNAYDFVNPISNNGKFVANEWNEYEIKISDTGIDFTAAPQEDKSTFGEGVKGNNIFCALSGGVAGTVINLDAVFFYKK